MMMRLSGRVLGSRAGSGRAAVSVLLASGVVVGGVMLGAPVASADTQIGAYQVMGQIEKAYFASGGEEKWGAPVGPESPALNGRFQKFANNVSFYWSPKVNNGQALPVGGQIRDSWAKYNWERGRLGYPTSGEIAVQGAYGGLLARTRGVVQHFQGGDVYWSPGNGAHPVWGNIGQEWLAKGGIGGFYGFPVSDEYRTDNGRYGQDFEGGSVYY